MLCKSRCLIAALTLTALVAAVFGGCSKQAPVTGPVGPLKVALTAWVGWAPLYLAKEKGLFAKHGIKEIELVTIDDTAARKAAMLSGQIHAYGSSVDNWALDSANGLDGKILFAFDESAGGDGIVAKKEIKGFADLKGKTVATQPGMPGQFLLFHLAKKEGISVSDIKIVDMDADKAGAAFVAGAVDAAVTWEPWLSKATAASGSLLASTKENRGLIVDVIVANPGALKERTKELTGLTAAWFEALAYWQANKSEGDAIMAKAMGLPVADFIAMTSGVEFFDLARNLAFFGIAGTPGAYEATFNSAAAIWQENKLATKKTDAKSAFAPQFLTAVNAVKATRK